MNDILNSALAKLSIKEIRALIEDATVDNLSTEILSDKLKIEANKKERELNDSLQKASKIK